MHAECLVDALLHLVLDGVWTNTQVFWWPFSGLGFDDAPLPSVERGWWNLVLEAIGAGLIVWAVRRFHLDRPGNRRTFLRTGHLEPAAS